MRTWATHHHHVEICMGNPASYLTIVAIIMGMVIIGMGVL
jgi:hypothetical protein